MPKNYKTQLVGQIGESLVVAELGRRGIVATTLAGNVPDIDVLAFANDTTLHLQVKAMRHSTTQFDAQKFIKIEFGGDIQRAVGLNGELDPELIYVFVKVSEVASGDRFFILLQRDLQKIILGNHEAWLKKHGGIRPRNPKSTHVSISLTSLEVYEDNWVLIYQSLGASNFAT